MNKYTFHYVFAYKYTFQVIQKVSKLTLKNSTRVGHFSKHEKMTLAISIKQSFYFFAN